MEITLRTKTAKLAQVEQHMRRMQQIIDDLQSKTEAPRTPMVTIIAILKASDMLQIPNVGILLMYYITIKNVPRGNKIIIFAAGVIRRPVHSPNTDTSSEGGGSNGEGVYQLANGGGDPEGDGGGGPNGDGSGVGTTGRNYGYANKRHAFKLVKSSNIAISAFSGSNLNNHPHLPFHKSMRRLIYNQGEDGDFLLDILTQVETWGGDTFTNEQLKETTRQYLKAAAYNGAITSVLLNYATGIAKWMVEYGVENGFDAWRRFYHHYLPFAEDLQQILIQELYTLSPVSESNIDSLFNHVERIMELYTTAGRPDDAISEKRIKVAVLRNLPKQATKVLAIQLRDIKTVDEVRNIVNIYMHDHIIGMPRGQAGPMLCVTEGNHTEAGGNDSTNQCNTPTLPEDDAK